jgi:hypothetical protein
MIPLPIAGAQNRADRGASNPVRGTFIANFKSPASGADGLSRFISTVCNRARTRDDDGAGIVAESGLKRNLHIANNIDGRRKNLRKDAADHSRQLWTSGTRSTNARARYPLRRDARSRARLMHRLVQGLPRLRLANAYDVAWPGGGSGDQPRLITHGACGLGPSAVNTEVMMHEFISNTEEFSVPRLPAVSELWLAAIPSETYDPLRL